MKNNLKILKRIDHHQNLNVNPTPAPLGVGIPDEFGLVETETFPFTHTDLESLQMLGVEYLNVIPPESPGYCG